MHRRPQHPAICATCRGASGAAARSGSWVVRQVSNTQRAGHDQRLPRLHARGGAADDDRLRVLLHARVDHPGRQEADGDRARAGRAPTRARASRACSTASSRTSSARRATIVRIYAMYEPLKVFTYIGLAVLARRPRRSRCASSTTTSPGSATGTLQSLILAAVLMIVGFQVIAHRPGRRRDLGQPQAARGPALPRPALELPTRAPTRPSRRRRCARRSGALSTAWPIRRRCRSSSPRSTKRDAIGEVVARAARRRPAGTRSSSSTTDRPTPPARSAAAAGATVVRHPYNKGNGAAVKTGIRRATGEFVLIIDGDGQHPPEDALPPRRAARRVRPGDRRALGETQATRRAAARERAAQLAGQLSHRPATSPISRRASAARGATCLREFLHLLPNGFSTPTTTTLAFIKAGYNVRSSRSTRGSAPASRRSGSRATARSSC